MYKDHKDIPTQYRRMILEETLEKRVSKVPLSFCNEIINEHIRMQEENENSVIQRRIQSLAEAQDRQKLMKDDLTKLHSSAIQKQIQTKTQENKEYQREKAILKQQ